MADDAYRVRDEAALEALVGEPMDFVRAKVIDALNPAMLAFIDASPLLLLATTDAEGRPDLSPKGDPAGFVRAAPGELLIPERPGNRLTFGFRNILRDDRVGLIFVVPGQLETLRVKGRASLHADPAVLRDMAVRGKPALLYARVTVEQCLFHYGKAFVRSGAWQPDTWPADRRSIAARGMASKDLATPEMVARTETALEHSYRDELY